MNMTPRNVILLVLAVVVGMVAGLAFPLLGLVLLLPLMGYVIYILAANKGATEADPAAAEAARQFTAGPGKAAIYVMRKGFMGGQQGMNVVIDGGLKSQFRTGRFVKAEVDPGSHTVYARMNAQTEGTAVNHGLTLAEGECVLLDAKLEVGALQGKLVFLETRDPGEARGKLAGLKLVDWQAQ
ncbi:MAG: hypothetical protein KDE15_15220 [Erythrobacter sp.]|nr:hypothetical protein [Erythrobacter sp.]